MSAALPTLVHELVVKKLASKANDKNTTKHAVHHMLAVHTSLHAAISSHGMSLRGEKGAKRAGGLVRGKRGGGKGRGGGGGNWATCTTTGLANACPSLQYVHGCAMQDTV